VTGEDSKRKKFVEMEQVVRSKVLVFSHILENFRKNLLTFCKKYFVSIFRKKLEEIMQKVKRKYFSGKFPRKHDNKNFRFDDKCHKTSDLASKCSL
jgi:hypothetical protein